MATCDQQKYTGTKLWGIDGVERLRTAEGSRVEAGMRARAVKQRAFQRWDIRGGPGRWW